MTSKELKRMSRSELLQMLLSQVEENERLKGQLEEVTAQLEDRRITCENAGSIAEAALKINGVFEAAEQAAKQYLDSIYLLETDQDELLRKLEGEAREKADRMLADANSYKETTMKEADDYKAAAIAEADEYKAKVTAEADAYWTKVQNMVNNLMDEHQSLNALLQTTTRK